MLFAHIQRALIAIVFVVFGWASAQAQGVQPVPPLTGHVIDTTGTLDAAQSSALEAKLAALEADKGAQLVVLMVPSTAPEDIASYANRVGNAWKIGRKNVGDGLIVLVAKNDRRMRIEVAKTLEGAVPDIAASHIIDEVMTPAFRRGDFAGGLDAAVDQLSARIRGEPLPPVPAPSAARDTQLGGGHFELIVFAFFAAPIAAALLRGILGRKLGALAMGLGVGALVFWIGLGAVLAALAGAGAFLFALIGHLASGLAGGGPPGGGFGGGGGRGLRPGGRLNSTSRRPSSTSLSRWNFATCHATPTPLAACSRPTGEPAFTTNP